MNSLLIMVFITLAFITSIITHLPSVMFMILIITNVIKITQGILITLDIKVTMVSVITLTSGITSLVREFADTTVTLRSRDRTYM